RRSDEAFQPATSGHVGPQAALGAPAGDEALPTFEQARRRRRLALSHERPIHQGSSQRSRSLPIRSAVLPMSSRNRSRNSFASSIGNRGARRRFRVRARRAQSAARFGIHGSTALLSVSLVRTFSISMLAGIPPTLCGVSKSGANRSSTPRKR